MRTIVPKTDDDGVGFVSVGDNLEIGFKEAEGGGYDKVHQGDDEVRLLAPPLKVVFGSYLNRGEKSKGGGNNVSQSDPWQTRFTNICQEIRNITHQSKSKERHILNKAPKFNYRDKTVSLDTHGASETDDVYSVYSTPWAVESGHNFGNPEHYDTPIYNASPTPPAVSPKPSAHHMPLPIPRSQILGPSSDVGLRRACSTDQSQYPLSCVNTPGESDQCTEEGVVMRGELSWEECKDSREGQAEGGDPGPNPLGHLTHLAT